MIAISLTTSEILLGATAGITRQTQNIRDGRRATHGSREDDCWQRHVEGCLGELAICKLLGVYWQGVGKMWGPDVSSFLEVRTAPSANRRLILHKDDHNERPYLFLTGTNGKYQLHGWIMGREGKQQEFWTDPGTGRWAFFIPKERLTRFNSAAHVRQLFEIWRKTA